MLEYKERTKHCSGCNIYDFPEHNLYHETGVPSGILKELNLSNANEVYRAFSHAKQLSKCLIDLNGRITKIREKDLFLFPKDVIDLIPNLVK